MKRFAHIALTALPVLLLAVSCTGRRTADNKATATVAGDLSDDSTTCVVNPKTAPEPARTATDTARHERRGPFVENDTTFLYRSSVYNPEYDYTSHCSVYIERNRESASHRLLAACSTPGYDDWNRDAYAQSLKFLKERHPEPLPVYSLQECPRTWIPIASFRGAYYVDMFYFYPIWITDSLFVRQMMDGPFPSVIEAFERIGPAHYRFRTTAGYTDVERVDLYIVEPVRKIAVFAFANGQEVLFHGLYAPLETACQMELVEWDCTDLPAGDEVDWDSVDYEALIVGRSSGDAGQLTDKTKEK